MKKWLSIAGLLTIFSFIGGIFWYSEWKFSLPTPVPANYHAPATGEHINLSSKMNLPKDKPMFLHFFNPDCPCSRFNIFHFKSLVKSYSDKISFAVVVITKDKSYNEENLQKKFGLSVPILFDTSIAALCGVYSTPQAVLLDKSQALYYRGNYNRSRYCTDKKSNYAQIAIDSLTVQHQQPVFNTYALTAYGCSLPQCKR